MAAIKLNVSNILDGCASLQSAVERLHHLRDKCIKFYELGATLQQQFQDSEGVLAVPTEPLADIESLNRHVQFRHPPVNLIPHAFINNLPIIPPSFKIVNVKKFLDPCVTLLDVIDVVEQKIVAFSRLHYDGWEIGDPVVKSVGILFPACIQQEYTATALGSPFFNY